ncbi:hypothetical protein [Rhizobium wenxiniae]|uniref:hypothetical protein n=1 Tax=Rhizobium wenxiniae TaxID=1737357 RepID=UPI003C182574
MAKRLKLGDIFQILTSRGVSYAQYTHRNAEYGYLIRVFSKAYRQVPRDFSVVVEGELQFSTFFPAQSAVNQGLISVVANAPVPSQLKHFPIFRSRNGGPGGSLWLWDGAISTRLERDLRPEEMRYPTRAMVSAPLLIERIEVGYRAETDEIW